MKAFPFTFDEGLLKGLRRFSSNPRNNQSLTECHNAMPTESGLGFHEDVISLDADDISWGAESSSQGDLGTTTITISVKDYTTEEDLEGVSVYLDNVLKGTTDSEGDIEISDVTIGIHYVRMTKSLYVNSNVDDLLNDYIVVPE